MKGVLAVTRFILLYFVLFIIPFVAFGQGSDDHAWRSFQQSADQSWQKYSQEVESKWDQFEREQREKWLKFKEEVERKWDEFLDSTKKTWVDYGKDLDTRSEVNFEKGTVEVTAIIPAETRRLREVGTEKIAKQVTKIFSTDNPAKLEALKDQVKNKKGEVVSPNNVDEYIKEEIIPQIAIEEKPYTAKDGVERIKVKARINLIPEHIRVRAEKYLKPVNKQGQRFQIQPQLILAIIHTESYFNPMAKSPCDALGLMQLIPRYGARDAYRFVYKKDRVLSPAYLYDPENNIELGTAYVHLLKNKHFGGVNDSLKNRYIIICAYNWGPTAVNRKIVNNHKIDQMDSAHLYALLREKTPQETKDYLKKVTERMKIYDNFY